MYIYIYIYIDISIYIYIFVVKSHDSYHGISDPLHRKQVLDSVFPVFSGENLVPESQS